MAKKTEIKLSGIIIARDEEKMIGEAIKSLNFADEIIVADSGSKDRTLEKVSKTQRLKDSKIRTIRLKAEELNFSYFRSQGLKEAKGEWIFYLDADERVTKELAMEIKEAIRGSEFSGYKIRRVNYYLGKKWPKEEKLERLFRKDRLSGWYGKVHESPKYEGQLGELKNNIVHYTHRDLSKMVEKTIKWSEIEARVRYDAGHPRISWWRFPKLMFGQFWEYYVNQGGYKAGTVGLIESMYQVYSIFITYARLWEMQREERN
ncbi:MAG: Glycosyl transferase family 2 [Candidatus Gottesmanbacteria bacterium GW2011_GWC2_39_8]|uniref:Glycosyl transferase family 2 n=1 Tax=Candidatus Gottesmanbacteria bacterium GW2011_GWC2_39_8 TaxID=1618450 RepID=A0A0G0T8X1_9BACT|nr:MAG: Glycosyl transferase family 2 [Candidatus Gottesmanbacteria bacterium GW2011_GWC2_39_8]